MNKEQIIEEAMKLNNKEREEVAELLLLTTSGGFTPEEIEKRWTEELKRRFNDLKAGKTVLHDGDEVINQFRAS